MDNLGTEAELKISNIRLNILLNIFSSFGNPEFKRNLNINDDRFTKEETYILSRVIQEPNLLDEYGNSSSREEIMGKIEITLSEKNNENKVELDFIEDWGIGDLEDISGDLDITTDLIGGLTDDDMKDLDSIQDLLDESEDNSSNTPKINIKRMSVVLNGIDFPIYLVENDKNVLSIFNKEPHKLAFLWTYPELEPVLNVPALLRLMDKHPIVDEEVDINYKDPNQIEYRLIKGMLALNVKGG